MSDPLSEIVEIGAPTLYQAIEADNYEPEHQIPWGDGKGKHRERVRAMLRDVLSALTAAGFAIVPIEPSAEIVAAIWRAFGAPDQDRTEALMKTWLQGHKAMIAALTPAERRE